MYGVYGSYLMGVFMDFDKLIRMLEARERRQREALEETVGQLAEARRAAAMSTAEPE